MFQNLDIFKMSHAMAVHAGRQQATAAQNVANADTPGFKARRLPTFAQSFLRHSDEGTAQRASRDRHLHGSASGGGVMARIDRTAPVDPNGNSVSLENEMLHALEAKRQHDRALAIYKTSLGILRTSLGR